MQFTIYSNTIRSSFYSLFPFDYNLGFKAHKAVGTCLLEYEDGRHQNATFYAGDDLFYDESGEELGNLTEIGCPTLTQELDNVS